ncbi:bacteriohopanetetrol glucosamine biosynthesis glycosyltransferase HpnI [Sphingomonas profundi]|uniref:bacteriohopanetetrol glucosamine biosynthesis glycosyltransferase HpnI n=1 Tax=Alterirhizorhabdus profundi TaxID=2681549 RepID=UPI001E63E492|nr:bacteriohopanetetrol glucosamine biosynthesis glycosyltransferase HpnI [Sphingomonas profundi]
MAAMLDRIGSVLGASMLGGVLLALAGIGSLYMLACAILVRRFFRPTAPAIAPAEPVTLLKPLHGAEPRLAENLASFLGGGAAQMLCGVARADDPAVAAVAQVRRAMPGAAIDLVVSPARHGANGKVANLVNMMPRAAYPILILSDSDIVAGADYLPRVCAALAAPGVGAVTCLYRGRGDAGFWSRLGAAGLSYQFLPGALFGIVAGLARPCMGSTIALRRETLDRIGGFARFADVLADDHAIGAAVRAQGLTVAVPPMLVTHASAERTAGELWRHELRWAATVRGLAPAGYAGSLIGFPLPLAMLGAALAPGPAALATVLAALVARIAVVMAVDRAAGAATATPLLLPLRDAFGLAIFIASFFARSIDWRGDRLRMMPNGRISADPEIPR